jgi:eukaryotic-like serine/threonine-protein kinase
MSTAGRLGPYNLLSRLGAGGFGEVHLALDPEGRTVAVKVLHPHVAADEQALTRLAREVETMRMVRRAGRSAPCSPRAGRCAVRS